MSVRILASPTSPWHAEWRRIGLRIERLGGVAYRFATLAASLPQGDYHGIADSIVIPELSTLRHTLGAFLRAHGAKIPQEPHELLRDLLARGFDFYRGPSGLGGMVTLATVLAATWEQVDALLDDVEGPRVSAVERAFLHLQRLLVVDKGVGANWRAAFKEGETACERLGGVQLLHHGIYAVKVNSDGERTDLILGTQFVDSARIRRSADAMALTEWKLVRTRDSYQRKRDEALDQARRYSIGGLAGFEIARVRFLVLVSRDEFIDEPELVENDIIYRTISLAVDPKTPSRSARRIRTRRKSR